MQFENILFEKENAVGIITFNRPSRLNSITYELAVDLENALQMVNEDDEIRVLVLTGAESAFCAGADLGLPEIRRGEAEGILEDPKLAIQDMKKGRLLYVLSRVVLGMTRLYKPVIAMVNGVAVGAAFDICSACDIRIGSTDARFSTGFIRFGASQGVGGTWFLPRIVGINRALQYLYTGEFFDGEEAYRIGYLNKVVAPERLRVETMGEAKKIAAGPPIAMRLQKQQVYRGLETSLEAILQLGTAAEFITFHTEDLKEGIMALAGRRPANFQGR